MPRRVCISVLNIKAYEFVFQECTPKATVLTGGESKASIGEHTFLMKESTEEELVTSAMSSDVRDARRLQDLEQPHSPSTPWKNEKRAFSAEFLEDKDETIRERRNKKRRAKKLRIN